MAQPPFIYCAPAITSMPNPMALGFVLIFGGIVAVQLGSRPLAPAASGAPAAHGPRT